MQKETQTYTFGASSYDELLDVVATCAGLGGVKPIHPSSLYRLIRAKKFDAPIKIGPKTNRWRKSWVEEFIALRTNDRGERAA